MNNKTAIGAVIVLAAGIWWFASGGEEKGGETVYQTQEVSTGNISRQVAASGAVDAVTMVEISTEVSGLISELYVDFNSPVKAGDLLATINPQIFQSRLRQRQAELKVAQATVSVRQAEVGSSEANLAKAERDYERVRQLRASGNVSEAALDEAETRLENMRLSLEMSKAQLANAVANVDQREASLEQAQIDFEKTSIRTPIDGIVIERSIEIGQTVAASFSAPKLFRIARDLNEVEIEAAIDEADIGNIKEGNKVSFTVDAYPDRQFEGTVSQVRLAPVIEQNVVTYTVVILARNRGQALLPGMTANVDVITGEREDVLRVPTNALRFRPRGANSGQQSAGGSGAEGMSQRMMQGFKQRLGLSDEQAEKLEEALKPAMEEMRQQFEAAQGGMGRVDRAGIMQKFRNSVDQALQGIATPEQLRIYRSAATGGRPGRGGGQRGQVYVLNEAGEPELRMVRLGISDGQFTEVLDGQISPGDMVVTGARTIKAED